MKTIKLFRSKVTRAFAISTCVVVAGAVAHGGTYTWRSSPSSNLWSDPNWNDGTTDGVTWADDASAPNDVVFGASSQKYVRNPGAENIRHVNDMTFNAGDYRLGGGGPLSIAGTVILNASPVTFDWNTLTSGRADGSLHFYAPSDWKIAYVNDTQNSQTSTYLEGSIIFAPNNDRAFGVAPSTPTENIFVTGTPTLFAGANFAINANRIIKISSGKYLQTGVGSGPFTFKCPIIAENTEGYDYSRNTYVKLRPDWSGLVVFDPGAGHTNAFGRLLAYTQLKIASGVTRLTGPGGVGTEAHLYVEGNGTGFAGNKGNLTINGGEVMSLLGGYVDVRQYGQVTVTNGGKVYMPSVQWLNGHVGPGRLTVVDGGEFTVSNLRISHSQASEICLDEGGLIKANVLTVDPSNNARCVFRFNGGRLQSRDGRQSFFASATEQAMTEEKASLLTFAVGEKGAVFDTSNGQNLWWSRPLVSDAAHDGGLRKIGAESGENILILSHTNRYNGVTSIEGGGVQLRVDNALPPGTTVRLSGNASYIDAYSFDSSDRATEQWIGRLEGSGEIRSCANVHVTNSISPNVNGSLAFRNNCELRGDYEIAADANGCGLLEVRAADQSISNLTLKVADFSVLDRQAPNTRYQILNAPNGYTGKFILPANWPAAWDVHYTATAAYLRVCKGTQLVIR